MIKKIISGILLSILVASCHQKRQESEVSLYKPYTIDLSEVEYSEEPQLLSDFVESIEYIKFSEEPLVPDLTCFAEDNNKTLWIGTMGGGLYHMDINTKEIVCCPMLAKTNTDWRKTNMLHNSWINSLLYTSEGKLYI